MSGDARGDLSGSTVGGGRYLLRSLLGEGGMASVHLGWDSVLERPVAVKTLHSELGREQSFRERFRREAQSVAKLNHPNIVSVFDSGEDAWNGQSVPYIVMEYVEGKPLRQILDEDTAQYGAMPADQALKITGEVLAALAASHEMGLIHRDIKPGNVMVTRRGVVKVMDFGIARALQSGAASMTQTGMVVGTPQYLSPEQALGRQVDARSDLYSVGCMLFELLTGRLPFDGDSPLSIAYQHVQQEPPAPSSVNPAVKPAVDAVVARALRKDPGERFPSAEAMQSEIGRLTGGEGQGPAAGAPTPLVISDGPMAHHGHPRPDAYQGFAPGAGKAPTPAPGPLPAYRQQTPAPVAGYGPPTPPPQAGYGPPTPPPAADPRFQQHSFQQGGYPTPAPTPAPGPVPGGYATPAPGPVPGPGPVRPPYGTAPTYGTPRPPAGSSRTPLIVLGSILAVIIIIVVISVASSAGRGSGGSAMQSDSATQSPAGSTAPQAAEAGTGRAVDPAVCTDAPPVRPGEGGSAVVIPDLTHRTLVSVEECLTAAGWRYRPKAAGDSVLGKGIVTRQIPAPHSAFDPRTEAVTLYYSTGHTGS